MVFSLEREEKKRKKKKKKRKKCMHLVVTTSLQLGQVAAHLAGSELGLDFGGLLVSSLLVCDSGGVACILGCRGGSFALAVEG